MNSAVLAQLVEHITRNDDKSQILPIISVSWKTKKAKNITKYNGLF